ncbi:hypothetical protein JCM15908A_03910 [Prevotella dentasini JCM 15908]
MIQAIPAWDFPNGDDFMIEWKVFQHDGRFDYNRFRYYNLSSTLSCVFLQQSLFYFPFAKESYRRCGLSANACYYRLLLEDDDGMNPSGLGEILD